MKQNNKKGQQLSNIVLGLIFTVGATLLFFTFIADGVIQYGVTPPSGYNSSFYVVQGITSNLTNDLNQTYADLQDVNSNTGGLSSVVSFFDFFFNAAFRAAISAASSIGGVFSLIDLSISGLPLGPNAGAIKGLLYLGITAVVIFLFIYYVLKVRP